MDITSAFLGITAPLNELYDQIGAFGWEPRSVKWDKKQKAFVAEANNMYGQTIAKIGPDETTAVAHLLAAIGRHTHMRTAVHWKLGMWKTMFTDMLPQIAEAYAKAPVYDPKSAGYFKELADDSTRRAAVLGQQLKIEVVDDPEPYANAKEMADDIHQRRHFLVSRAHCEHPVWSVEQNIAFRIVHDVLGHAVSGGDFGWQGENLACAAHFPLLTPTAQIALFTECIAQTAYAAYYRSFGPQKVAAFPEFVTGPQATENPHPGYRGIHPSQSVAPTAMPQVADSPSADQYGAQAVGQPAPHQPGWTGAPIFNTQTLTHVGSSAFTDPNAGWSSGQQPMTLDTHGVGNAYLDHGDPLDSQSVMDNAALIDTNWHSLKRGDGSFDRDRAKLAICNAFRVVLLSPRKDLRWNAIHYQDISGIPANTDDPKVYWNTLEQKRREWNESQGVDPNAHMIYFKYLKPFESVVYQLHPELGFHGAKQKAEQTLFDWWTEEQQRIESEDAERPSDKQRTSDEIERRANEALAKRMDKYLKDKFNPKTDVQSDEPEPMSLFGSLNQNYIDQKAKEIKKALKPDEVPDEYADELMRLYALLALTKGKGTSLEDVHDAWSTWTAEIKPRHKSLIPFDKLEKDIQEYDRPYMQAIRKCAGEQYNLLTGEPSLKYGAFMGTHLKAISQISQHADEILDAALEDVRSHDAAGHHFRAKVLQLGISGVGPKVCSFAWLLLQPLTSELGTIDTHMMDVLGHDYEKEMNNRDYFKFERELAAGRDAAGYGHVPLGPFQWGMWDYKRTGEGSHQDHSAMAVLDPKDHRNIDWASKALNLKGGSWLDQAPDWWRNTQNAREGAAQDFERNVAPNFAQNKIPYQVAASVVASRHRVYAAESTDEFHVGLAIPDRVAIELERIAETLEMTERAPRSDYHMTVFWSEHGYEDQELHKLINSAGGSGFHFDRARLEIFPGYDGRGDCVVMRFESPSGRKFAHDLMDQAEDHGLEIKRFDGGWKAHVTLGWTKEKTIEGKFPGISFQSGAAYVSVPRPLRRTAEAFSQGFEHWWENEKPVSVKDAKKMAEYAAGTKTSRKQAVEFIERHKEDVRGDYSEFRERFLSKFDRLRKDSRQRTAGAVDRPWFELDGQRHEGLPGQTVMEHARDTLKLPTVEIWRLLGESAGKAHGDAEDAGELGLRDQMWPLGEGMPTAA